jgi:hypothetical protein
MANLDVHYNLPVSALRFSGTVTEAHDTVLHTKSKAPLAKVELEVVASRHGRVLRLDGGIVRDTSVALALTDDGRLQSANVTSTGEIGKVVLGVAGFAVHAVALFAAPVAALGAFEDGVSSPEKQVADAYRQAWGEVAEQRDVFVGLITDGLKAIGEEGRKLLSPQGYSERAETLARLRLLEQQLPAWRSELDRLNAHYAAWRAGTIVERTEEHEAVITLDTLRGSGVTVAPDGAVSFNDEKAGAEARSHWDRFGLTVTMDPEGEAGTIDDPQEDNRVVYLVPRVATLSVYARGTDGKAELQRTVEQLVVDSACEARTITFDKSWLAERKTDLTFSSLGALTGISRETKASAASLAETLGSVPATVAGAVENAQKLRTAWVGLRGAGLSEELDRAKKEVELHQQKQTAAGLAATDTDYAELERLKQQADLLAKKKAIGDAALDTDARAITALKNQIDLLKGQKDLSEATRTLRSEQELYSLRLEIERLKDEKTRRDNEEH